MLTCQNITIHKGNNIIVENISFSVFTGACLNIYGSNGSGKTSLINYIATLSDVFKSTILVNNTDILQALEEYKGLICYVGHKNALNLELTVRENLQFWARILGRENTLQPAIECFGLSHYLEYPVSKLSQGWQRKVALTRLLISDAKIWLLDEPFSNLDQESCEYLINLINIRCNQKGIVLLTSHRPIENNNFSHLCINDFIAA